jgi:CBS domain-containing protein
MGLRQDILEQPVTELTWRKLIKVAPTDSVRSAIAQMQQERLGGVVVVGDDGRIVGEFTERELIGMLLEAPGSMDDPISKHMGDTWGELRTTDSIARIVNEMQDRKLRYVLVVDDDGIPVGLTGQKGVMEYIAEHFPRQVKVQTMDSKLHMDQREGG